MSPPAAPVSILILAGGRGSRMGGQDKGLLDWRGRPLVAWLHAVARPLTDDLLISCNRHQDRYAAWADRLVGDDAPDFPGPLAGIRAGLHALHHDHLLVLPCDAPQVDAALLRDLIALAAQQPSRPVMVRQGEDWEPLFCVIPAALTGAVDAAWDAGERSTRRLLLGLGAIALPCPPGDPRLANLNTPDRLAQ